MDRRPRQSGGEGATGPDGRRPGPEQGTPEKPGGPTWRDGLELHVAEMRKAGRSERSITIMSGEVGRYLADWLDRPVTDLTALDLQKLTEGILTATVGYEGQ